LIELARACAATVPRSLGLSARRRSGKSKLKLLEGYRKYGARFDQALRTGLDRGAWDNYHSSC
jgi:hypothetical protein